MDRGVSSPRPRWNHNIHYHDILLAAVPPHAQRALEVGCGEGNMARKLRRTIDHVTAIDADCESIARARAHDQDRWKFGELGDGLSHRSPIDYIEADFMTYALEPRTFDFVVCVAALHHMDARAALTKMADLVSPGGALAILGLARSVYPKDLPHDVAAVAVNRARRATKGWWDSPAPQMKPNRTYEQISQIADEALEGARFSRHLLWRYSIVWCRPPDRTDS
jgi:2-polyprenyl-3-methyl-5-hydroxy-6-metoxy-1,4-benzoquinol methylase